MKRSLHNCIGHPAKLKPYVPTVGTYVGKVGMSIRRSAFGRSAFLLESRR